jgi:hypothetical protein
MDISAVYTAALTWIFANPQLALYGAGGVGIVVLLISLRGLKRSIQRRKGRERPGMPDQVLDRDEVLSELTEPFEPAMVETDVDAGDAFAGAEQTDTTDGSGAAEADASDGAEEAAGIVEDDAFGEVAPDPAATAKSDAESEGEPGSDPQSKPESKPEPQYCAPSAKDLRSIARTVFESNFPKLHSGASDEARRNVEAFIDEMMTEAETRLSDAEIARFAKADIQLLLYSIFAEVAKRLDTGKNGLLIGLLFGRVRHDDKPDIVELLDEAIEVCGRINTNYISVVVMCLYLRSIHLRSNDLSELETVVKYATGFGEGASFSNMRTGPLFSHGLLMYNAAMDRIEGQLLRNYGTLFEVDPAGLDPYPGENQNARQMVHNRLNLSPEQTRILETWGQSQCGRATATGVGWAAAAAFIERATGQPADWERMIR